MAEPAIILFDGVCNLCNGAVQFVIKRDDKRQFLFASLQSEEGRNILKENNFFTDGVYSFILVENGRIFDRSTAALSVAKRLRIPWKWLYIFIAVPKFIRDAVYDFIAKNRYRWFGKKDECMVPTTELKERFLNQ